MILRDLRCDRQYYSILKIGTGGTDESGKIIDETGMIEGVAGTETIIVLRTAIDAAGSITNKIKNIHIPSKNKKG